MRDWQKYALPLGSAMVVALLLDCIISFDWLMKETFLFLYPDSGFYIDLYDRDEFPFLYLIVRALLSLLLWGILFSGPTRLLFGWVIISVIVDSLRHGNLQMMYNAMKNFDIYLFIIMPSIRVYNIFVIIEIARVLEKRQGSDENLDEEEQCELLPVGKGASYSLLHYKQFTSLTAVVLLTVDAIWNLVLLPTMKQSLGSLGGFIFVCLGIALDVSAISFIKKKLSFSFSCWKILYALFIFTIFIIFSSLLTDLRHHPSALEYVASLTFASLLLYRSFVLFCCLLCQMYPEASPSPVILGIPATEIECINENVESHDNLQSRAETV